MSQLSDIINQINQLTGYNVPTSSNIIISQSATPVGSGSVNQIVSYINGLTGFNIPSTNVQYVSGSNVAGPVIVYLAPSPGGTIPTEGIQPGAIIRAEHILRIIYALSGVSVDDIIISGSLSTSGSNTFDGNLALPFIPNNQFLFTSGGYVVGVSTPPSASFAESASYALTASYAGDYTPLITFNAFTSSYSTGSFSGSFIGVLQGTASWAISASNALTASHAPAYLLIAQTGSMLQPYLLISQTGSMLQPYVLTSQTASMSVLSSSYASTASYATGYLLVTQTGSMLQPYVLTSQTASMTVLSSSRANTASYTPNAIVTASVSLNTITFDKGDTSTFTITVDTGSAILITDYVTTASFNAFTSSVVTTSSFNSFTASYTTGSFTGSFVGDGSGLINLPTQSFDTSSLVTTGSFNAFTASIVTTSSFNTFTASAITTASVNLNTITFKKGDTSEFSITVDTGSGGVSGNFVTTSSFNAFTSSVVTTSSFNAFTSSVITTGSSGASQSITGSLTALSITGSLSGTASWANNAVTASAILGGKATHVPFFITDTTLATSSIYQSGSSTVIINQDNATTANPEALYVWQPSTSSFNVISGKGNLNNYLQLNIQNNNQGTTASSDVVATAGNGNEFGNYVDMGINSDNYTGDLGGPNDAYLYTTGSHLHIGNASPDKPVQFFAGGFDTDIYRKFELNPNNRHNMTGSLEISGGLKVDQGITGSLLGLATSASYADTASYVKTAQTASYVAGASVIGTVVSASHAINADNAQNAVNAAFATVAGNGGVTQIVAGTGVSLIPTSGLGAVTVIATGVGGVTIISGSNVTESFNNSTSWNFQHNLGTRVPIITVFDTSYNQIIPENITLVDTASATITFPTPESGFAVASLGGATGTVLSSSYSLFSTYADTASYYTETDPIFVAKSGSLATTGSNRFIGNQTITGSLTVSGSSTFTNIGLTSLTGSLNVTGSTTQRGNNTLIGNTVLSGSIDISGSQTFYGVSEFYGNHTLSGSNTIVGNTIMSGSIEVSGSSNFRNSTFIVTGSSFFKGTHQVSGSTSITGSFNVVNGDINIVSGSSFTRWGNKLFNYGQFSDTTIQSGSANTAYAMKFNTTDFALGTSLVSGSRITVTNTGIYNLQFSAQLGNTANTAIDFDIWFAYTGSNIANSNTQVTLNKVPGSLGKLVAAWNFAHPIQAGDYVEIMWSCTSATGQIQTTGTQTSPTRPAIPSVIATLTQIA